jgi:cellobiose phosphorylase
MRDHLEASLEYTLSRLGQHDLPLIGRADWNDCLNLNAHSTDPDESFQTGPMRSSGRAESIMIGALFVLAARDFAALATAVGDAAAAARYRTASDDMTAAIVEDGWDGRWFLRAYDHSGQPVGSHRNPAGQIFLEPQALCAMAGIGASTGFIDKALQSVAERLAGRFGVQLLDPPYRDYHVADHRGDHARSRGSRHAVPARDRAHVSIGSGYATHRALRLRTDGRGPGGRQAG